MKDGWTTREVAVIDLTDMPPEVAAVLEGPAKQLIDKLQQESLLASSFGDTIRRKLLAAGRTNGGGRYSDAARNVIEEVIPEEIRNFLRDGHAVPQVAPVNPARSDDDDRDDDDDDDDEHDSENCELCECEPCERRPQSCCGCCDACDQIHSDYIQHRYVDDGPNGDTYCIECRHFCNADNS